MNRDNRATRLVRFCQQKSRCTLLRDRGSIVGRPREAAALLARAPVSCCEANVVCRWGPRHEFEPEHIEQVGKDLEGWVPLA